MPGDKSQPVDCLSGISSIPAGVSTRTIYRDINILSIAGIPITSQKGYGGGLSLLQGFSLDKSYFTQAEQSNIIQPQFAVGVAGD